MKWVFFYIATGHYAQNIQLNNTFYITYAADSDKDQTFFLWGLKQDILCRMLLPMGGYYESGSSCLGCGTWVPEGGN